MYIGLVNFTPNLQELADEEGDCLACKARVRPSRFSTLILGVSVMLGILETSISQ